jgi:hypothetical protein
MFDWVSNEQAKKKLLNEEINQYISGQVAYNGYAALRNATEKPGNKRYLWT